MRAALLVGIGSLLLAHASVAHAQTDASKKQSKHHHHHHKDKKKAPAATTAEPEASPPSQPEAVAPSQPETPPTPEPPKPSPPEAVATAKPAAAATSKPAAPAGNELNFDLFAGEKKKSPAEEAQEKEHLAKLERSVKVRRGLLLSHQAFGFITLGAMAATLVIGQLQYLDKYGHGNDVGTYYTPHEGLAIATTGLFATTGILALAAPNPYPKPLKLDAALVHKVSMAIATAGMVAQIVLGPIIATREGKLDQRDLAMAHQVTGYATFGFMGAGVLAYVF